MGTMGAEGGREDDRTHKETRKRGRRRKGRGQCRRTEPEALKFNLDTLRTIVVNTSVEVDAVCSCMVSVSKAIGREPCSRILAHSAYKLSSRV